MNPRKNLAPEIADLWTRLDGAQGKKYWRTLEELADTETFQEMMRREFPEQAATEPSPLNRRQFLTLMGASLALAGLSGCSVRPAPTATMVPYVRAPEEIVPGRPLFYATAMTLGGCGVGLLVESHLGRPTKIEGNPDHPASLGATDLFHQASVLTLYDPDRSQTVTHLGETRTWDDALTDLRRALAKQHERQGAGLRVLTETIVSPTLIQQLQDFLKAYPKAQWHQYEPLARDAVCRGAEMAFGKPVNTYYDFKKADVVLSFDGDFLTCGPGNLRYVADFMSRRRVRTTAEDAKKAEMNRLYMVETTVTSTGAKADHRLAVKPSEIEGLVRALAAELKVPDLPAAGEVSGPAREWLRAVADDLRNRDLEPGEKTKKPRSPGTTLVVAGDRQSPVVHLLVQAINKHLGNVGSTVLHTAPIEAQPAVQKGQPAAEETAAAPVERIESLRQLAEDMDQGRVEMLIILGGNPVFTAPADFRFKDRMQKVALRVHLSLFQDETSFQCHWHLPEAHYLESWSDTRSFEGTVSIVQPLIEPLYQGRSAHELLAALTPVPNQEQSATLIWHQVPGNEIVRAYWKGQKLASDFETFWQESLHDGVMAKTAFATQTFAWVEDWKKHLAAGARTTSKAEPTYELVFHSDPTIHDGRFANNGWLQELPKPITTLTWDNAALMSPATAKALRVTLGSYAHGGEHGGYYQQVVELEVGDRKVRAPAWIMPGHADGCITVYLGYGREAAGRVGGQSRNKVGFNAYELRTSDHPWFTPGLAIHPTKDTYLLSCTQQHHLMENREVVRAGTLAEYRENPRFAFDKEKEALKDETRTARKPLTLYEPHPYTEHKWGMVIDLTTCTGCKACVVACQAENNIPVVGKDQVAAGREMHWLRIDRYISGPFDKPTEFHFQPLPCMHCENAPCEYVCPVEATVHSADGLNDMVYQRCVGTRFCSNNCPYKVRRFNFFEYGDFKSQSVRQQYNPDVTVRSRGVMEKCSYCVQRIRHAEIDSQVEGRPIFDGEILTACQAACPAQAILFGDINDKTSKVKQWKDSPLHYALLADLNTEPRTTYLAALRNPNPDLEGK
jgi:MoCo/4Fe-4S cofactor protein with predicted Tat translocation signal